MHTKCQSLWLTNNASIKPSLYNARFYSTLQPCDHGLLDDVAVLQVTRRAADAVHFVESALPVGKLVQQRIDWKRRLDHMQQHSGKGPSVNNTLYLCRRNQHEMKTSPLSFT